VKQGAKNTATQNTTKLACYDQPCMQPAAKERLRGEEDQRRMSSRSRPSAGGGDWGRGWAVGGSSNMDSMAMCGSGRGGEEDGVGEEERGRGAQSSGGTSGDGRGTEEENSGVHGKDGVRGGQRPRWARVRIHEVLKRKPEASDRTGGCSSNGVGRCWRWGGGGGAGGHTRGWGGGGGRGTVMGGPQGATTVLHGGESCATHEVPHRGVEGVRGEEE
jgi:hypothetical protein